MSGAAVEVLIIVIVVCLTVALHALVQTRFKSEVLRKHNDVAGYLFSAVGVIYAVVLGFVVVVVWEKYDSTRYNVDQEVAAVSDLYRSVGPFDNPERDQIRSELRAYVGRVIDVEWPQMRDRVNPPADVDLLENLAEHLDNYQPRNLAQSNAQQVAMTQRVRLFDARRQRLIESAPSVPLVLWFALLAGAASMLTFAYLFGVENHPAQLIMTAILTGLIAVLFVVIDEFDHPFSGSVRISDAGWVTVQQHLSTIP
jgi:Protein of unknown function (DUF4239)